MYLHQDHRRQQLLEVGLKLFGSRSYDEVSIDEIAAAAEVSRGLMYHYFRGKRGFYTEVVRMAAGRVLEAIVPDPALGPRANLERGLRAYLAFVDEHADAYLALMCGGVGTDDTVIAILEETRTEVVDQILEGMGASLDDAKLRLAVRAWIGGAEAAALQWLVNRDVSVDYVVSMLSSSLAGILVATVDKKFLLGLVDRASLDRLLRWRAG